MDKASDSVDKVGAVWAKFGADDSCSSSSIDLGAVIVLDDE